MSRIIILISISLLSACSTGYQDGRNPFHLSGGYGSEKGPGNLEKVYFSGNGFTSSQQANQYAIRRSAEIGRDRHQAYFAMYQTLTDAANDHKTHSPLTNLTFNKPFSYVYIAYHNKKEPGDLSVANVLNKPKQ